MSCKDVLSSFYKHDVKEPIKDIHAALFTKEAEEPFIFSTRAKSFSQLVVLCVLFLLFSITSKWQLSEGDVRNKQLLCNDPVRIGLALTYFTTFIVQLAIYVAYSARFKKVFPKSELKFHIFERRIPPLSQEASEETTIPYSRRNLKLTIHALRKLIKGVERGEKPLFSATKFLLSSEGKNFLNEACRRFKKLQLFDNRLVRIDESQFMRQVLLWLGVSICCTASVAAAYAESQNCSGKLLFVHFLDKFSITLLTVLALAAFAGLSEYAQIFCTFEEKMPLSDDECFLLSLVAANSEETFRGIASSDTSGYANILHPGSKPVFIPIHMSLFAFKKARTVQEGTQRLYNKNAADCLGNYFLI